MKEEDKPKTAFTVGTLGFFECNRMPFGLTNSPATFQYLMEKVIGNLNLKSCLVYLDDIVIFSSSIEEHLGLLCGVLIRLHDAGLKLKPSKCHFLQRCLKYLGHIVTPEGIECDPDMTKDLLTWKVPPNVKEIQRFIGFAGFYRRYVQDFTKLQNHCINLLVKGRIRRGATTQSNGNGMLPIRMPLKLSSNVSLNHRCCVILIIPSHLSFGLMRAMMGWVPYFVRGRVT